MRNDWSGGFELTLRARTPAVTAASRPPREAVR
jgi:hypothetical protein